jgi:hypothetical protein
LGGAVEGVAEAAVKSLVVARDNDVEVVGASVDIDYWDHWGMDEVVADMDNFPCEVEANRTAALAAEEVVIGPDFRKSLKLQHSYLYWPQNLQYCSQYRCWYYFHYHLSAYSKSNQVNHTWAEEDNDASGMDADDTGEVVMHPVSIHRMRVMGGGVMVVVPESTPWWWYGRCRSM